MSGGIHVHCLSARRAWIVVLLLVSACADPAPLTRAELMDPAACQTCHPDQYQEWSGSMHAYAADSPIFRAMLVRGQRETAGGIGDLCVRCHAPMALEERLTFDGLNLPELLPSMRGVTCYFCHTLDSIDGPTLAHDGVLRAGFADPVPTSAHASGYSPLRDRTRTESSGMCAICHANTYAEWQQSLFSSPDNPAQHLSCGECHMTGRIGLAANADGVPERRVHEHTMAGVDVALTDWPETQGQLDAIARDLNPSVFARLCVRPGDVQGVKAEVILDNVLAGHMWPSGVPRSRRAWVEILAYVGNTVVYQSGVVADDQQVEGTDPDLWVLREWQRDGNGTDLLMPWQTGTITSELLPPSVTNDPASPLYNHSRARVFEIAQLPTRITMRLRLRPVDFDMVDDLASSGDLDPGALAPLRTFDLSGAERQWDISQGLPACTR